MESSDRPTLDHRLMACSYARRASVSAPISRKANPAFATLVQILASPPLKQRKAIKHAARNPAAAAARRPERLQSFDRSWSRSQIRSERRQPELSAARISARPELDAQIRGSDMVVVVKGRRLSFQCNSTGFQDVSVIRQTESQFGILLDEND